MKNITSKQVRQLSKLIDDEDLWDRKPTFGSLTEMDDMDLSYFIGETTDDDENPLIPELTEEDIWGRELEKNDSICQQDFAIPSIPEMFLVETTHFGMLLIRPEGYSYARYVVKIIC